MMTGYDRALAKVSIMRHEGFSPRPVPDTKGSLVLGYGWNPVFTPMAEPDAQYLLEREMDRKEAELLKAWPLFASCDGPRARCLLEMAYQVGVGGLLLFPKLLHCVANKDYQGAKREVLNSTLAKQTPLRAQDYAALLIEDHET